MLYKISASYYDGANVETEVLGIIGQRDLKELRNYLVNICDFIEESEMVYERFWDPGSLDHHGCYCTTIFLEEYRIPKYIGKDMFEDIATPFDPREDQRIIPGHWAYIEGGDYYYDKG